MITIFIGPMFSGKTQSLISSLNKLKYTGTSSICVKYPSDIRYSKDKDSIVNFDSHSFSCKVITTDNISGSMDALLENDNIVIDEGQFFVDLVDSVIALNRQGKNIIIGYLNLDFQGKPFPNNAILLHADRVVKLSSVCVECKGEANYSHLKKHSSLERQRQVSFAEDRIMIGSNELYEPRCIRCFPPFHNR